jgi:hypothetical protein
LDADVEINSAWEKNRKDIKISAKESLWHSIRKAKDAQNYYINGDAIRNVQENQVGLK